MPKTEHPLEQLRSYLPENSFDKVVFFLQQYKVHLTITAQRQSILGDYRNAMHGKNHRISINGNLNKFSFLITLIHEIAHLVAFETYGHKILAHGKEWKFIYSNLLKEFITINIFPGDIETALHQSVKNPAASSCAEEGLMRVLRRYDKNKEDIVLLEEIPQGAYFITIEGRVFKKGAKLRKRFRCTEKNTDRVYLISGLYEVKLVV
jgi:hypothetical protein